MFREIYLDAPDLGSLEKKNLNRAIDSGYVSTIGPFVPEFEDKFAKYIGCKKAVSTQSGTAALHMALYELGIGKGDEVIVPALTFVASVNPVVYVGAKPVFVDVDIDTWNINPTAIEKAITKRTKAIIPVHLYGNPCNLDKISRIARVHGLYVIEDATESLGAKYRGRHTGTFGDFGCFSFNGNKTLTTGGGGMIVGKSIKRTEHIKFLVNQARDGAKGYYHPEIGFNYRMTNIEAAIGLAQMEKIKRFVTKKAQINKIYKNELGQLKSVSFQREYEGARGSYWLSCLLLREGVDVEKLRKTLQGRGIPARRVFMPLTEFPYYKIDRRRFNNAYSIYERGICLPSSTRNNLKAIHLVSRVFREMVSS